MKKIKVREDWCLGCHLCEYYCAYANSCSPDSASGPLDMAKALKGARIHPRVRIEDGDNNIHFAVSCRHCEDAICVKSCIAGAISKVDGVVRIDKDKCVGCHTCVLVCPFGALAPGEEGTMQKCELCIKNSGGSPACVKGCINRAIVLEEVD
ncbi:MAG: 4Fe-4S dicluster domain-containing protein [Eubacteriales bacterium]